jgi:hypothetical protein
MLEKRREASCLETGWRVGMLLGEADGRQSKVVFKPPGLEGKDQSRGRKPALVKNYNSHLLGNASPLVG